MRIVSLTKEWEYIRTVDTCKIWYNEYNDEYLKEAPIYMRKYGCYAETIASQLCVRLFPNQRHAVYRPCTIHGASHKFGTIYKNFYSPDENFVSLEEAGFDSPDYKDILTFMEERTGALEDYYLAHMFLIDYLLNNTGRKFSNMGFIYNRDKDRWSSAPLFEFSHGLFQSQNEAVNKLGEELKHSYYRPFDMNFKNALAMMISQGQLAQRIPTEIDISGMAFPDSIGFQTFMRRCNSLNISVNGSRKYGKKLI